MSARSSILSPGAIRNRRYRRRLREELTPVQVEVPNWMVDVLIELGSLGEDESDDKSRLGEAIIEALEERL